MKIIKIIIPFIFLFLGFGLAFLIQDKNNKVKLVEDSLAQEQPGSSGFNLPLSDWQEREGTLSSQNNQDLTDSKSTIYENKSITADKSNPQTGEEVKFSINLINKGKSKKFITHVCFNHSGGVTFGCVLGVNLDPGQEFPISGSTKFTTSGTYSVWLTWSQDKTNFYRTGQASSVWIKVL